MHIASYDSQHALQIHMSVFIFIIAIVILLSAHQSNLCLKLQSFYLWMVIMVIKVIMVIIVIVVIMDIIVIMAIMVTRYLSPWSHWLQDIDYLAVTLPSP